MRGIIQACVGTLCVVVLSVAHFDDAAAQSPGPCATCQYSGGLIGRSVGAGLASGAAVVQSVRRSAGPVYSNSVTHSRHWSWPGDLHDHLRSAHGINTTGMTREEMMTAHDRAHEVGRVVTRSSSVTRSYRVRLFRR